MTDPYSDIGLIQRFRNAVEELRSAGYTRHSLNYVFQNYLIPIRSDDLPEHLREDFESLLEACTWLPPEYHEQGKIDSTTTRMSSEEVERCAEVIFAIYKDLKANAK